MKLTTFILILMNPYLTVWRPGPSNVHIWALGLSCPTRPGRRGSHTTARELQTCTFQGPGTSNTTKIPRERHPERHRKSETVTGKGRKSAKFWASHPSGPHPSGPPFGPHPSGAPPFGAPPFWAPLFLGLGPPPLGAPPFWAPPFWAPPFWAPPFWAPPF